MISRRIYPFNRRPNRSSIDGDRNTIAVAYPMHRRSSLPATTVLSSVAGDASVTLTWTPVSIATAYIVKRSTSVDGPFVVIAETTQLSLIDIGLANGTTYYYVVIPHNMHGDGPQSNTSTATPTEFFSNQFALDIGASNPTPAGQPRGCVTFGDPADFSTGFNKFTLAYWVNKTIWNDGSVHIHKNQVVGGGFYCGGRAVSRLDIYFGHGTPGWISSAGAGPFTANTWHHVTIVYDGTGTANIDRLKVYRNAAQLAAGDATRFTGTIPTTFPANGSQLFIAGRSVAGSSSLNIRFDEVAWWFGVAASDAEVADLYNGGAEMNYNDALIGPPTHWWRMENDLTDSGTGPSVNGSAVAGATVGFTTPAN